MHLLINNNNEGNLQINEAIDSGNNKSSFVLADGEFENVLLTVYYDGRFRLKLESRHSDSPYTLDIDLDENLAEKFPDKMSQELEEKYYDSIDLNE